MRKEDLRFDDSMMFNQQTIKVFYDYLNPLPETGRLLEIGTGLGHFIRFFSELKPKWMCYTCDAFGLFGDGRVYERLEHDKVKSVFEYLKDQKNIVQILGDSSTIPWELPLDVLIIDAGHTYQSCKTDFLRFSPFIKKGGIVIFDDYEQPGNPTNGVKQVVDEILQDYELLYTGIAAILRKI